MTLSPLHSRQLVQLVPHDKTWANCFLNTIFIPTLLWSKVEKQSQFDVHSEIEGIKNSNVPKFYHVVPSAQYTDQD